MPPGKRGEEMNGSLSGLPHTADNGPWSENLQPKQSAEAA